MEYKNGKLPRATPTQTIQLKRSFNTHPPHLHLPFNTKPLVFADFVPLSVYPFAVFIVQSIATRQSNQGNNSTTPTTTTSRIAAEAAATSSSRVGGQFKATTTPTNSSKLIVHEYVVDQGKNFTSSCPVTDAKMVSFWFRTWLEEEGGGMGHEKEQQRKSERTISWEHQVSGERK